MLVRKRGLDATKRADLWRRWRAGQSLSDIGRALAKPPGSVFMFVAATGGISPPARKRRGSELTFQEREEISRGLSKGESQRSVAARLRRAVSTVSREVARNGGSSQYHAAEAETAAWLRARRPKVCRLAEEPRLRDRVAFKLSAGAATTANSRTTGPTC